MEKDRLISLAKEIYRLTLLFPKKEPLRYKIREKAGDILACLKKEDLELLNGFLEVAKEQNWVKVEDILALQQEYDSLRQGLLKEKESEMSNLEPFGLSKLEPFGLSKLESAFTEELKEHPQIIWPEPQSRNSKFCERHDKIMAFLKESGRAQVWQIKQILPDVSKRTLRRDFEFLVNQGVIERIGERNDTFYQIKLG